MIHNNQKKKQYDIKQKVLYVDTACHAYSLTCKFRANTQDILMLSASSC